MSKKLTVILSYAVLLCAFACQKNTDVVRDEYIRFYLDKDLSKAIEIMKQDLKQAEENMQKSRETEAQHPRRVEFSALRKR